ncbi:hypothetical protein B0H67DRAFT_496468 [Lasiosphaeris hirsuta]|uniref:Uncharacterized protein n=1 Tax=Lasiosphaeris hirsuta TaxID=260670 RepID=A0AA40DQL5_9PEZI|nr:hypothetical protein B0H67DRAFT_496468 [Lasiosphaeris hirsuta]
MACVVLQKYLNDSPSVADGLLSGVTDKPAVIKARKAATKDMLTTWQSTWEKLSHEEAERQVSQHKPGDFRKLNCVQDVRVGRTVPGVGHTFVLPAWRLHAMSQADFLTRERASETQNDGVIDMGGARLLVSTSR